MPATWSWVIPGVLSVALIQCSHAPESSNQKTPPHEKIVYEILNPNALFKGMPSGGPSKEQLQTYFEKLQQFIDSDLMPRADPNERGRLLVIKKLLDRASRAGEPFFDDADNIADYGIAIADVALIAATIHPDDLELQLQLPSDLLMTVATLEGLRDASRDLAPDVAKYTGEALKSAGRTVERFPRTGNAYGELAFVLSLTGGSKKEMRRLYKRCLELDSTAKNCSEGLRIVSE